MFSFCRRRRLTVLSLGIIGVVLLFYLISYVNNGTKRVGDSSSNGNGRHLAWRHHHHHDHHGHKRPHHSSSDAVMTKVCKVPHLSLRDDRNKAAFHPVAPLKCAGETLIYIHKSVLHFNQSVQSTKNLAKCDYRAIEWTKDTQHTYSNALERTEDFEIRVHHDFLHVQCYLKPRDKSFHSRMLLQNVEADKNSVIPRKHKPKKKQNGHVRQQKDQHHMHQRPNAFGSMGLPDPPILISRTLSTSELSKQKSKKKLPVQRSRITEEKQNNVKESRKQNKRKVKKHILPKRSVPHATTATTTRRITQREEQTVIEAEETDDNIDQVNNELNQIDENDGIQSEKDLHVDGLEDDNNAVESKEGEQKVSYDGQWVGAPEYDEFIAQIYPRQDVYNRTKEIEVPAESTQMNVLVFVIDSLSHLSWQRKLPRTYAYLTQVLDAEVMKGYNVVGDDSPAALIPILTGKFESELPKVKKNAAGSTYVDSFPLVWNQFEQQGYVTLFAEDQPHIGAFNLRYNGFEFKPTDHYMRTFWQAVEDSEINRKSPKFCLGSKPKHRYLLEYLKQFFLKYSDIPRFAFAFHGELSHLDNNPVEHLDKDLTRFLEILRKTKVIDNTLLVFMSDHGSRVGKSRGSIQGKLEQRLPLLSLVFPPEFKTKYGENIKRLKHNAYRLTTPFDLHETLLDLLDVSRLTEPVKYSDRGISLLKEVPLNRTCQSAGIDMQWCSCLAWQELDRKLPVAATAAEELVRTINTLLQPASSLCEKLTLKSVLDAKIAMPNEKVMKFGKKVDQKERLTNFTSEMLSELDEVHYQVIIQTEPNKGVYEATVKYVTTKKTFLVNEEISRFDVYGNQPNCVVEKHPSLMKYCMCK